MIKIGDREVVYSRTFMIPKREEAVFVVPLGSPNLKIALQFDDNPPSPGENKTSWSLNDNVLRIKFKGWTSSLGTVLQKPTALGNIDGVPFGFNVIHYHLGEINFTNFELYSGGTY